MFNLNSSIGSLSSQEANILVGVLIYLLVKVINWALKRKSNICWTVFVVALIIELFQYLTNGGQIGIMDIAMTSLGGLICHSLYDSNTIAA